MLKDIIQVDIAPVTGYREQWCEEDYGTVAFKRQFMESTIGTGLPVFDGNEFLGFDPRPNVRVAWPEPHPSSVLQVGVWLEFVPIAYREDVEAGAFEVGRHFKNEKIDELTVVRFVEAMRGWIFSHVVPTDEHRPRSERWAREWFRIGITVAQDQKRITPAEAASLIGGFNAS